VASTTSAIYWTVRATRTYVALIRGVNVGGRNRISMAELRSAFSSLGHEDVSTLIQSGNVVFRSDAADVTAVAREIEQRLADDFGLDVSVLLRTPPELSQVAGANPFLAGETDLSRLHVLFLGAAPAAGAVAGLDPSRSPPDRFSVHGHEIYVHYPNGAGRSRLTVGYFESRLGVGATARNWNTVLKLAELAHG